MTYRNTLLAMALLALPAAAQAQPISGLYIGAGLGLNLLTETDISLNNRLGNRSGTAEFALGSVSVASIGWGFGNGSRAELEVSSRTNKTDSVSGFGLERPIRSGGHVLSYGLMANALYDFRLGLPVQPYVGLGFGYIWQNYEGVTARSGGDFVRVVGSDGSFAYQAILGAALPLPSIASGLALTAEYRFLGTLGHEVDARSPGVTNATADVDNFNHSLLIGLRYAFGAAAPAPAPVAAPAAAPAPARAFQVFFDFDRADLTDRARAIIAEAAQSVLRTGSARIEVAGHADRAGTPQHNQRLSERRAQAVAAELERRGVPRSAMIIQAFGESRPLVPTADGVREPQNRRVEIVLR